MTGFLTVFVTACGYQYKPTINNSEKPIVSDTINHGYNELANPNNRKSFTISDFNTDNKEIKNIDRPSVSIVSTNLDTALLFGIWTNDPDGPHADFWLTNKSFFVVDYDGDGDMPYELKENKLKIYYNDFIQEGKIISVDKDTLKIMWKDFDIISNYVRWTQ
ncbi:MAG: hypothetical protein KBB37_02445 [Bacteroidia bacterium]|nr:hypothetical protein [Bacteroidia bacterium]MBP7260120.1 hypothetical protein [Bacteroidia bacterium]